MGYLPTLNGFLAMTEIAEQLTLSQLGLQARSGIAVTNANADLKFLSDRIDVIEVKILSLYATPGATPTE